jgi:hypothetical protein
MKKEKRKKEENVDGRHSTSRRRIERRGVLLSNAIMPASLPFRVPLPAGAWYDVIRRQ